MLSLKKFFRSTDDNAVMVPLYRAIVESAREPHWYIDGQVPDTVDGRFEMIATLLALVLLRLEGEDTCRQQSAWLTELFVEDMDGQLRQIGIGDYTVGKHIGKLMGALGGRIGALRTAFAGDRELRDVLLRNLYRGEEPAEAALDHSESHVRGFHDALGTANTASLLEGSLPDG